LGATQVEPREDSDELELNGSVLLLGGSLTSPGQSSSVGIDNDTQLGITVEYFLDAHWGIELLAATPFEHTATGRGAIQGLDIAEFKHLPPTLMAVYHFSPMNGLQPYVGAGVNYTFIYDEDITPEAHAAFAGLGLHNGNMKLDDSMGASLQAGVDYHVNDKWLINASARWIDIDTEAKIIFDSGDKLSTDISVDPWVYTLSVGYKF
ncbi:MAG: OmpW/AlkL family protein, partial [Spongiibacteraceae bacterium]